jgi:hypothetical protein
MTDQYTWWRNALAGNVGPMHDGEPQSGRYRLRNKNKQTGAVTYRAVAYWRDEAGALLCRVDDEMVGEQRALELWSYCAKNPISAEEYKCGRLGRWSDLHPAAEADRSNAANAPDPDSVEAIKDSVENLAREAEALIGKGAAKTKGESDQAADLADRLRKLEVKADTRRKEEHEPHKTAIKALDGAWNPVRDLAAAAKERLKLYVVTPFLKALDAQAAKLREQAAKLGDTSPQTAAAIDKSTRTVAGTSGRAALRDFKSATITDYPKALAYFAENAKVKELIQTLADAAIRSGTVPEGCELHVDQRAA